MGEAKRRGTQTERSSAAQKQNEQVLGLIANSEAPHYAFIIDRSPRGQRALAVLKEGPPEIRERFKSAAFQFWEQAQPFEFVIVWGTWGYTGGLTVPVDSLDGLIAQGIPSVVERVLEKGGYCAFLVATDEKHQATIEARLAELHPVTGAMH